MHILCGNKAFSHSQSGQLAAYKEVLASEREEGEGVAVKE